MNPRKIKWNMEKQVARYVDSATGQERTVTICPEETFGNACVYVYVSVN